MFFLLDLREAREPGTIQQAVTDKVTATTIQFRFVAPHDTGLDFLPLYVSCLFTYFFLNNLCLHCFSGGLPIDSFAAEFKESTQQWDNAKRRVWPASKFTVLGLSVMRLLNN